MKSEMKYKIEISTDEDVSFINKALVDYNSKKVPFTQENPFVYIDRVIKDTDGSIMAGINTILYCWNCLYIDILYVAEEHRGKGYGSVLLREIESIAREKGCRLAHLDTFDFQAKDFYLGNGYEVFGVLEECPEGHKRYYMKKVL